MNDERLVRTVCAVVLALLLAVGVAVDPSGPGVVAAIAGAGLGAVLAGRAWPDRVCVPGLLLAALAVHVVCTGNAANVGWFAVCALATWAGATMVPVLAVPLGAVLVAGFVWQWLVVSGESGWGGWMAGTALSLVAGLAARRQRLLLEALHAAQTDLADAARDQERSRIARELHDVIGHALTVSLLHITSARLALAEDPEEAAASLDEAERLSRESLTEVRAVVGLMRRGPGGDAPDAALPGAESLDAVVASYRRAGADVDWAVVGDLATLTATAGLTVYRILQEALTNAVRHAPGAPVRARLTLERTRARLVVSNPAPVRVPPAAPDPSGTGLAGMRARAEALGGSVAAGPVADDWRVEAVLPR